jgi:hypothetical protein
LARKDTDSQKDEDCFHISIALPFWLVVSCLIVLWTLGILYIYFEIKFFRMKKLARLQSRVTLAERERKEN